MNLSIVLILATTFTVNKAKPHNSKDALPQDVLHKTAAQLAKLIHLVSYANVESGSVEEDEELADDERAETSSDSQPFDLDYYIIRNDKSHVRKKTKTPQSRNQAYQSPGAKSYLEHPSPGVGPKLAHQVREVRPQQAYRSRGVRPNPAYQAGLRPNEAYHSPGVRLQKEDPEGKPNQSYQKPRLHMISNPRVLEEYQKLLKPFSFHHFPDEDKSIENSRLDQRRNAIFRLDADSIEKALRTTNNDDLKIKKNLKLDKDVKEGNQDIGFSDKSHDIDALVDDDKRKKGREDGNLKQDDVWDVITEKYDWKEKHSNQYEDTPRNKNESQKKIQKFDDNWNKKATKQDFADWDKKITKPDAFNDWPKKKKNDKNMKWESADRKPKVKKDFNKSYERPRKPRKYTDRDITVFKLSHPRTTKKWKQVRKDDWDKAYAPKISSYHSPRNKKARDGFDSVVFFGRTPIPYIGRQGIYADN